MEKLENYFGKFYFGNIIILNQWNKELKKECIIKKTSSIWINLKKCVK